MIELPLRLGRGMNAREQFTYDAESGVVMRRSTGRVVGTPHSSGYLFVNVDGKTMRVHRLIWFLVHGTWPVGEVDHINGNRADNRLINLRDIPKELNAQNLRSAKASNHSTGVLGVSWDKRRGKFKAQITIAGRNRLIGRYSSVTEAQAAYLAEKRKHHEACSL